jgi:hypothetical protein
MIKLNVLLFICLFYYFPNISRAQGIVGVAESTLKVSGLSEEVFYYGFAEGDKLIFEFEEVNGKELKEIEILEMPSSSKFMDYKTKKITSKTIEITRTAIYKFRFSNSALGGRICRFKIQRIPTSTTTQNFNTNVYWQTVYDTTYTPTQERYLEKTDTTITNIVEQIAKVSSQSALNGKPNKNVVDFTLPENTIAWSFYIGVGAEGKAAYETAKEDFLNTTAKSVSKIPGYGTMAALALYGLNTFNKVQGRDNVQYWFITDWNNVLLFQSGNVFLQYKQGDVVNDAVQMKTPLVGKVYLGLLNDNVMEPIEVIIRATAIQVHQIWGLRTVNQISVSSRLEPYLK